MSTVKGKGFRHEKTKKKRGTYRGMFDEAHLTLQVNTTILLRWLD